MHDVLFRVDGLDFYYGSRKVLHGVTLDIVDRGVTALMGPSGCGKSTFIRVLNRMYDLVPGARAEGRVLWNGRNLFDPSLDTCELRSRVGMVFQRSWTFPGTVFNNVAYGLRLQGGLSRSELDARVERSLRRSALWEEVKDRLKAGAHELSGGQQQRLCIARALAVEPQSILMDEPASALDPKAAAAVENTIMELAQDVGIVLVTHSLAQARRVANRAGFFFEGILVEHGDAAQVFGNPREERTRAWLGGAFG